MEHRIDFAAASELFSATSLSGRSRVTYMRFDTAARAIQYAIEELKAHTLRTTTLEVSEVRLRGSEIRELYDSPRYPLRRRTRITPDTDR